MDGHIIQPACSAAGSSWRPPDTNPDYLLQKSGDIWSYLLDSINEQRACCQERDNAPPPTAALDTEVACPPPHTLGKKRKYPYKFNPKKCMIHTD